MSFFRLNFYLYFVLFCTIHILEFQCDGLVPSEYTFSEIVIYHMILVTMITILLKLVYFFQKDEIHHE